MQEETVYCDLDHFIAHYFSPMPNDDVFDKVLKGLVNDGVLIPMPKKPDNQEKQYGLLSFRQTPSKIKSVNPTWVENKIFAPLQSMGDSIRRHVDECNDFRLCVVPTKKLDSDVKGCNFQMDACLTDAEDPKAKGKLHVDDIAMPFEFKIEDSPKVWEEVRLGFIQVSGTANSLSCGQNRHQLASSVVHIMNDDMRRNFMYAVCIFLAS